MLVAEALAYRRSADKYSDLIAYPLFLGKRNDSAHFVHRSCKQRGAGNDPAIMLDGSFDKLLCRDVRSEIVDLYAAALHHDLNEIFADIVHISAHGADNRAADGYSLSTLAYHVRL